MTQLCRCFWVLLLLFHSVGAAAQDRASLAARLPRDTIEIEGVRIRLWGIDAPEMKQRCQGRDGQVYECGRDSAAVMAELTRNRTVECDQRDRDRYGRVDGSKNR